MKQIMMGTSAARWSLMIVMLSVFYCVTLRKLQGERELLQTKKDTLYFGQDKRKNKKN